MGQFPARIGPFEALVSLQEGQSASIGEPVIRMDAQGRAILSWGEAPINEYGSPSLHPHLFYRRTGDAGASWSPAQPFNNDRPGSRFAFESAALETDGKGRWAALWVSNYRIVFVLSDDGGQTWSPSAMIDPGEGEFYDFGAPSVATDGSGKWVAIWNRQIVHRQEHDIQGFAGDNPKYEDDVFVSTSTDDAVTWSPAVPIYTMADTDGNSNRASCVGYDRAGGWLACWVSCDYSRRVSGQQVAYSTSNNDGAAWTEPRLIAPLAQGDYEPRIAANGSGHWLVTWSTWAEWGTLGSDADIMASYTTDGGETWRGPTALNTTAVTDEGRDILGDLAMDGMGNWVAVWSSNDTMGNTLGTDTDIFISHSADNGATWSPPAVVNKDAPMDLRDDVSPRIATDGNGTWVVVWASGEFVDGKSPAYRDSIKMVRFTLPGYCANLPFICELLPMCGVTCAPVAMLAVVFTTAMLPRLRLRLRFSSKNRLERASIQRGKISTYRHRVHCGTRRLTEKPPSRRFSAPAYGIAFVTTLMFQPSTSHAQFPARIGAFEDLFVSPDRSAVVIENPQIEIDPQGRAIIVWSQADLLEDGRISHDSDLYVRRSADAGVTWSPAETLNGDALSDDHRDEFVALASDGKGTLIAVWTVGTKFGTTFALRKGFARSDDWGETWSMPSLIEPSEGQREPSDPNEGAVATSGSGVWIAAWIRMSINRPAHDFPGSFDMPTYDFDFVYSRSVDDGMTWSPVVPIYTLADNTRNLNWSGELAIDESGTWLALWTSMDGLASAGGSGYHVVVATSNNDGADWTEPRPIDPVARGDGSPRIAMDGKGNWLATWSTRCDWGKTLGTDPDVMASVSTEQGATWRVPTALNTNAVLDDWRDYNGDLATDGQGNWVAVWESNNTPPGTLGGDFDIYISHSGDNGTTWTAPTALNGDALSDTRDDVSPRIATNGKGDWLVIWIAGMQSDAIDLSYHDSIKMARFSLPDECANPSIECNLSPMCGASCASGTSFTSLWVLSLGVLSKSRRAVRPKA